MVVQDKSGVHSASDVVVTQKDIAAQENKLFDEKVFSPYEYRHQSSPIELLKYILEFLKLRDKV